MAAVIFTVALEMAGARATTAGMVFLVVVVVTATQAGLVISLYSALLCAVSFDYFFLPLLHNSLHSCGAWQEGVSMLTFAVSSLVAGRVAERARKQKEQAEQRREDVERLYLLSQEMILREWLQRGSFAICLACVKTLRSRAWCCTCRITTSLSRRS